MKKGEITSAQLVTLIILVLGFVLLLMLYYQIAWTGRVDNEVCHESVILRATAPDKFDLKEVIPLKCQTEKICITDNFFGKGDCEMDDFGNARVGSNENTQSTKIKKEIADKMAECWTMMGEGKISVFSKDFEVQTVTRKCVICSVIGFDKDLQNKKIEGFVDYLLNKNVSNKEITYWGYITNSRYNREVNIADETKLSDIDSITTEDKAVIFIETRHTYLGQFLGGLLVGGAAYAGTGALIGSFVPGVGNGIGFAVGAVGGIIAGQWTQEKIDEKVEGIQGDYVSGVFLVDYTEKDIKSLGCDTFENIP